MKTVPPTPALDRGIFHLLLTVVGLAPLPFGAVHGWAWNLLALAVGGLLVAWSQARLGGDLPSGSIPFKPRDIIFLTSCSAGLLIWIIVQAVPDIPAGLYHPIWGETASILGENLPGRIGLDPQAVIPALTHLGTYGGIFWLALHYGRDTGRASLALGLLATSGALYALYGLVAYSLASHSILWLPKTAYSGDVTGTFINRNNYATFAGLGWLCLLALLFRGLIRHAPEGSGAGAWFRAFETYVEKRGWLVLLGVPVLAGALLASHSRGGLLATMLGSLVFCLALGANAGHRQDLVRRFALVVLVLAGMAVLAGGGIVAGRLAETRTNDDRLTVYGLTLDALRNRPLIGTGVGTFEENFRMVRSPAILSTFAQAHNTYLETALELGVPALLMVITGLGWIASLNWAGARHRRRNAVYPCLGLGATTLVGSHACLDFSIQVPAVASTYALVLGVSLAQSWRTATRNEW
jgi:O-antigen ligase